MNHAGRTAIAGRGVRPEAVLVALLVALCGACRSPDVRAELADTGFRTPRQTFETFRAAFVADLPSVEFDCLSADFRGLNNISELTWREAREIMLDEQRFLRWGIGRAKVRTVERLSSSRARIVARSASWLHEIDFEILMKREDFYEVYVDGERADDDFLSFSRMFRTAEQSGDVWAQGYVKLQNPDLIDDPELREQITELRVGREWKIDGFRQLDSKEAEASAPDPDTP